MPGWRRQWKRLNKWQRGEMRSGAKFVPADDQTRNGIRRRLEAVLLICFILQCCGCTSAVSDPIVSPDKKFEARIIETDGGATEPLRSSVEIRARWGFTRHTIFFGDFGAKELEVSWLDDSHLKIRFPEEDFPWNRPVDCTPTWKSVSVSCEVVYPSANSPKQH